MDNKLLEDNMKEAKTLAIVFVVASALALVAYIGCVCSPEVEDVKLRTIIVFGILIGFLFLYSLYSIIYVLKYKVEVYEDRIYVCSLFGKKSIKLTKELQFECKKYNSRYSIFKITVGNEKITVRTKRVAELTNILQRFKENIHG